MGRSPLGKPPELGRGGQGDSLGIKRLSRHAASGAALRAVS